MAVKSANSSTMNTAIAWYAVRLSENKFKKKICGRIINPTIAITKVVVMMTDEWTEISEHSTVRCSHEGCHETLRGKCGWKIADFIQKIKDNGHMMWSHKDGKPYCPKHFNDTIDYDGTLNIEAHFHRNNSGRLQRDITFDVDKGSIIVIDGHKFEVVHKVQIHTYLVKVIKE